MNRILSGLFLVAMGALAGCSTMAPKSAAALQTVDHVDLDRYLGRWQVIAHVPNFLEKDKVATSDIYERRADGRMDNIFAFRKGSLDAPEQQWKGIAWVKDTTTNARWKVRLFWPFTADYRVLELDPDYRWSVVSNGDGSLVCVLARETSLPENVYQEILGRISARGLDRTELVKVPQPSGE